MGKLKKRPKSHPGASTKTEDSGSAAVAVSNDVSAYKTQSWNIAPQHIRQQGGDATSLARDGGARQHSAASPPVPAETHCNPSSPASLQPDASVPPTVQWNGVAYRTGQSSRVASNADLPGPSTQRAEFGPKVCGPACQKCGRPKKLLQDGLIDDVVSMSTPNWPLPVTTTASAPEKSAASPSETAMPPADTFSPVVPTGKRGFFKARKHSSMPIAAKPSIEPPPDSPSTRSRAAESVKDHLATKKLRRASIPFPSKSSFKDTADDPAARPLEKHTHVRFATDDGAAAQNGRTYPQSPCPAPVLVSQPDRPPESSRLSPQTSRLRLGGHESPRRDLKVRNPDLLRPDDESPPTTSVGLTNPSATNTYTPAKTQKHQRLLSKRSRSSIDPTISIYQKTSHKTSHNPSQPARTPSPPLERSTTPTEQCNQATPLLDVFNGLPGLSTHQTFSSHSYPKPLKISSHTATTISQARQRHQQQQPPKLLIPELASDSDQEQLESGNYSPSDYGSDVEPHTPPPAAPPSSTHSHQDGHLPLQTTTTTTPPSTSRPWQSSHNHEDESENDHNHLTIDKRPLSTASSASDFSFVPSVLRLAFADLGPDAARTYHAANVRRPTAAVELPAAAVEQVAEKEVVDHHHNHLHRNHSEDKQQQQQQQQEEDDQEWMEWGGLPGWYGAVDEHLGRGYSSDDVSSAGVGGTAASAAAVIASGGSRRRYHGDSSINNSTITTTVPRVLVDSPERTGYVERQRRAVVASVVALAAAKTATANPAPAIS